MHIRPFKICCKKTALKAYRQGIFSFIGCDSCKTSFSITDDLAFFIDQVIAYYRLNTTSLHFDLVLSDGNMIFLLPCNEPMSSYTLQEIEEIVVMERLHLYNKGLSCGAQAISQVMDQKGIRPLPSISTIKRMLSRNCLTHGRTGYYPEDDTGN